MGSRKGRAKCPAHPYMRRLRRSGRSPALPYPPRRRAKLYHAGQQWRHYTFIFHNPFRVHFYLRQRISFRVLFYVRQQGTTTMQKLDADFRNALNLAFDRAVSHLEHLDESSVAATLSAAPLREKLDKPLGQTGVPPQQVIEELAEGVQGGLLGSAGGRFFGWVIGGAL